jgi:hypothetical protein
MAGNVYLWSTTAADNDDADGDINWTENQNPSTVNNSARGMMAAEAGLLKDTNGSITSAGSANGYTFTSNTSYSALATGIQLGFKANHTNTGASTLVLNALASKAIRKFTGAGDSALTGNDIIENGHYTVRYDAAANSAAGAWMLMASQAKRTVGTAVTLTTQTDVTFSSIPSGVVRIEVMLNGVSVSGTDPAGITIGDAGGLEATGYNGSYGLVSHSAASSSAELSTSIQVAGFGVAGSATSGILALGLIDGSTTWVFSGVFGVTGLTPSAYFVGGTKQLSAVLTQLAIGINGADTLDAGTINIAYYHA